MSAVRLTIRYRALLIAAASLPAASAAAQTPAAVRVVDRPAPIQRWFRPPGTEVMLVAEPGTTLDVIDEEKGWYWVIMPPDAHGTRRAGWIRVRNVEPVALSATRLTLKAGERSGAAQSATASTSPSEGGTTVAIPEDKVTITPSRDEAATGANASAAAAAIKFEDVHFDRDRYALRAEDMDILRATVAALRANPSLVVTIEGHTCNLGTPAYNLALGVRRADAVKNYLVSEGIAVERLRTVSFGEERPKHDNATEETRRLNRRVAVVPSTQP